MSKIGKFIIENLTAGMYSESKIIYREYIQNAADQIDIALANNMFPGEDIYIDIAIDGFSRTIIIKDNATGIPSALVAKKLGDVADSDKELGIDKGFRGIGRLGGLAYCDTLRFITTAKGETIKTIMTWDAQRLMALIQDRNAKDSAEELLNQVISYQTEQEKVDEHYFIVELIGIRKENHELLDLDAVRKYISWNTPVPYASKFLYRTEIYSFLEQQCLPRNEYKIYVNDEEAFKNYGTYLYESSSGTPKKYDEIFDIEIKTFNNANGEMLAWMWYGISRFEKAIPTAYNEMRGLKLRQSNILLDDGKIMSQFFKQSRGNSYFVGEIHAVHVDLIPNARRDYFNENHTRNELEAHLEEYFSTMQRLYFGANDVKNAYRKEIVYREKELEYQKKQITGFVDDKERDKIERDLEIKKVENAKAQKTLENLRKKTSINDPLGRVIQKIENTYQPKIDEITPSAPVNGAKKKNPAQGKTEYVTQRLSKLDKKQQKLVSRIYGVINDVLPENLSQELIKKIQDELSK